MFLLQNSKSFVNTLLKNHQVEFLFLELPSSCGLVDHVLCSSHSISFLSCFLANMKMALFEKKYQHDNQLLWQKGGSQILTLPYFFDARLTLTFNFSPKMLLALPPCSLSFDEVRLSSTPWCLIIPCFDKV